MTLEGSFSAVSTATIARVGAFFQIFRDLQDLHAFAPLQTQNISYFHQKFEDFSSNFRNFANVHLFFFVFLTDFDEIFSGFHQI